MDHRGLDLNKLGNRVQCGFFPLKLRMKNYRTVLLTFLKNGSSVLSGTICMLLGSVMMNTAGSVWYFQVLAGSVLFIFFSSLCGFKSNPTFSMWTINRIII
ncbi:hypothetical protein XENORESO_020892 [Xenotaenia resolanae]|uniref:Uncharacterized protein n=1 Tax=Xenotaenia resolanae TaxID=208358 RepID=A0ABV0WFI3_9TELE